MLTPSSIRALELFAGLGGFSAAVDERVQVVEAIDISQPSQRSYQRNYATPFRVMTIESLSQDDLQKTGANFWWLSPPCQPFTQQGRHRDWHDERTAALRHLIRMIGAIRPDYVALENVPAFWESVTRLRLLETLYRHDYAVHEWELCPTQFGLPSRRLRYYLGARLRRGAIQDAPPSFVPMTLADVLTTNIPHEEYNAFEQDWLVPRDWQIAYGERLDILERRDPLATTRCFTSAYGRSPLRSGSYLRTELGPRFFRPDEILRLLGFPAAYRLPHDLSRRQAWHLAGNSLAIPPVQHVVHHLLVD